MTLSPADIERELRYVHRFFSSGEFVSNAPAEKVEATVEQVIRDFKDMAKRFRPLSSAERAIVTLTKPRTAALLADRVWTTASDADPNIGFGWELPMEIRFRALLAIIHLFELRRAPTAPASGPVPPQDIERLCADLERDLARGFHDTTGATVLPLYSSASRRDAQYHSGDQPALVSIVENLNIVDEEQLTWEQITEFRRDEEARAAYRRFVHWLDKDMVDKSVEYIADEVAERLEGHEWALRKHGIKTVTGSLSSTINPKSLVATSTAGLAVDLIAGKPIWSLLTAGGLLVGHAAVSMVTALVERRDVEMAHREVAYVQQIKTRLGVSD
jgi:hypothetical protein